jgi:site-specific recombinase XerD
VPKIKLTTAAIERLKPNPQPYWDISHPAFAMRVSKTGVKAFIYAGRVHGKLKWDTLGRYPELSLAEARRKAGRTAEAMRQGVDPTAAKRAARIAPHESFEAVADEWLKRDQASNRSYEEVRRVIERDVKPSWSGRPIKTITRRDALNLIDGIADRGVTTLARRTHAHLHRLFRWCVGRGIIEANPLADAPKPGAAVRRDRVLSDAELATIWTAAGELGWPFGPVIRLLMLTGARRDEIGCLRRSELHADLIELAGVRTKNGEPHAIPLPSPALAIVQSASRITKSEFVFTTTGTTPVSGWSKAKIILDAAITRANGSPLPDWRFHDLRRSVATGMQRLGVSLQCVEAVLGHVSGSRAGVVGIYQRHGFDAEKRHALEAWATHVMSLVNGAPASNVVTLRRQG